MRAEDSDNIDDIGRRHSENQLRNKMNNSKYLDDVIEQTGLDYDEAMDMIERERIAVDNADTGFLTSLDVVHPTANDIDRIDSKNLRASAASNNTRNRTQDLEALLSSAGSLLKIHAQADQAITDGTNTPKDSVYREQAREEDRKRVKDVLTAGKRVLESEIEAKGVGKGKVGGGEVVEQAKAVFGTGTSGVGSEGVGRTLKYMEKGVKKMGKGLDGE